jgi:hypothetical protein
VRILLFKDRNIICASQLVIINRKSAQTAMHKEAQ